MLRVFTGLPTFRKSSPAAGSTFTTSAPMSASVCVQIWPENHSRHVGDAECRKGRLCQA